MAMGDKQPKSWSLTALAAEFDLPFKTAMSYRKGYLKIAPDVKVTGQSKLQFSPKQAAKFLTARVLFKNGMPKEVVQAFFTEVMDEYDSDGMLFSEPVALPHPETVDRAFKGKPEQDKLVKLAVTLAKKAELREEMLDAVWLVTFNPATKQPFFIICRGENEAKFQDLIQTIYDAGWKYTLLSLGLIRDELWNRVKANYRCMDYKPKSAGEKVKEALAAYSQASR
jgi:hypothetical protein